MKKTLLSGIMLLFFAANVLADEVTFTPGDFTATTSADYSTTKSGITMAVEASTVTADQFRFFKGKNLTISSTGATITKIVITSTATGTNQYGPGNMTGDGYTAGTDNKGTWTGSATSVTLNASQAQVRATEVVVTYTASSDTRTATTVELTGEYETRLTPAIEGNLLELPTATVKAGDAAVSGATVTWTVEKVSGNDALVPTISEDMVTIPEGSTGRIKVTASYAGDTNYQPSTASYNVDIYKGRMNIAEILEDYKQNVLNGDQDWAGGVTTSYWQVNGDATGSSITPINATVTYVNGSNTYIKDENGDCMLFFKSGGIGFDKGDVISGQAMNAIYGTVKTYNGLLEMEVAENNFTKVSTGAEVTSEVIEASKLGELENMNRFVKIENAELVSGPTSRNYTFKVGDTEFVVRQNWTNVSVDGLTAGSTYNVEGLGAIFNGTPQLYLVSFEVATGINSLTADDDAADNAPAYNLAGQQVNGNYKGIVVKKGKKYINK